MQETLSMARKMRARLVVLSKEKPEDHLFFRDILMFMDNLIYGISVYINEKARLEETEESNSISEEADE